VVKESVNDERRPDRGREEPEGNFRKLLPDRKMLAVVHVERGQHQNVGDSHAGDMQLGPVRPLRPRGIAPPISTSERKKAYDEQVVVLSPTHERQRAHGDEHPEQAPDV
jgi:hypothetical protein